MRCSRFAPAWLVAAVLVAVSGATRVLLLAREDVVVGAADWVRIFGVGLGFDLVAACYVTAPMVLWLSLLPDRVARTRAHRAAALALFAAATFAALLLAVSEWLFWDEFGGRFNFIAVDYLLYTHEVLGNIWQSYPVGQVLLALAALAAVIAVALRNPLMQGAAAPLPGRPAL